MNVVHPLDEVGRIEGVGQHKKKGGGLGVAKLGMQSFKKSLLAPLQLKPKQYKTVEHIKGIKQQEKSPGGKSIAYVRLEIGSPDPLLNPPPLLKRNLTVNVPASCSNGKHHKSMARATPCNNRVPFPPRYK